MIPKSISNKPLYDNTCIGKVNEGNIVFVIDERDMRYKGLDIYKRFQFSLCRDNIRYVVDLVGNSFPFGLTITYLYLEPLKWTTTSLTTHAYQHVSYNTIQYESKYITKWFN
jgi:hypothetical protein